MHIKGLISDYESKKKQIKKRLKEFRMLQRAEDEDIFAELCFCILTPQSKAVYCDKAIRELKHTRFLFDGCVDAVKTKLKGVRFPNNKANYLVEAREFLRDGRKINIIARIDKNDIFKTRDWLAKNIKGIGYKEASHFLRNIGLGKNLAILDTHILKNLKRFRVIKDIPVSMSKKAYLDIEEKMRNFSSSVKISLDELDLLFWSNQTGFIFK